MDVKTVILFTAIVLPNVDAICDKKVLANIANLWKGHEPNIILHTWVGKTTHVWASPAVQRILPGMVGADGVVGNIGCYQTVVDTDRATTTDYVTFVNNTLVVNHYYLVMERPGRVTIIQDTISDYFMYVVYMRSGVTGYFMCDPDPNPETSDDPGVGVRVVNYNRSNKDQAWAIQAAKWVFTKLHLGDGVDLGTKCPARVGTSKHIF